jgi:hypothetical protein
MVEVKIYGSDGEKDLPVTIDYLWDNRPNFRTYGIQIDKGETLRVNALELEDAMRFCREHQGD